MFCHWFPWLILTPAGQKALPLDLKTIMWWWSRTGGCWVWCVWLGELREQNKSPNAVGESVLCSLFYFSYSLSNPFLPFSLILFDPDNPFGFQLWICLSGIALLLCLCLLIKFDIEKSFLNCMTIASNDQYFLSNPCNIHIETELHILSWVLFIWWWISSEYFTSSKFQIILD